MYIHVYIMYRYKMRVDVFEKVRRRRGKFFDKEIISNRAEGAKKNSGPPLGPK